MQPTLFKKILSTLIYTIVLFFVLLGNNFVIYWGLSKLILPLMSWFYDLNLVFKLLVILLGGSAILSLIFGVFKFIGAVISVGLLRIFIYTETGFWISAIMCVANIIISLVYIWPFTSWQLWGAILWSMVIFFIIEMNWVFVFRNKKEFD